MAQTRKKSLGHLWAQLADAPPNIASLKWDPATGAFEATFRAPEAAGGIAELEAPIDEDPRFLLEKLGEANWPGKAD